MAQRVLAIVAAVAFVFVAIAIRSAIDDGGNGGEPGDQDDNEVVVACDTDLEAYCEALRGVTSRIEDSATTSAGLLDGTRSDVDAWVTTDAWLELTTGRANRELGSVQVVAASPVVAAVDADRASTVSELCGADPIWRCLGDHAGEPWSSLGGRDTWGPLKIGLPAAHTATGLSVLASVAVGYFGDATFAANEFDAGFQDWLSKLTAPAPGGDPDPANTLVVRRGTYSAAGATAARVEAITRPVERLDASPVVQASIVLVQLDRGDEVREGGRLGEALLGAGWDPPAADAGAILKPGVMAALYTLWTEVSG